MTDADRNRIGSLKEKSLHAALKKWFMQPGDLQEQKIDGYIIDIVRGDLLIEIQTRSFSSIKNKLRILLEKHPLLLVYPIAQEKWIVRLSPEAGHPSTRRKSPKHGRIEQLFNELLPIPDLISHPNFNIEILFIRKEEIWQDDGQGSWRRKGVSIVDHVLIDVLDRVLLRAPEDFRQMLPTSLSGTFTNRDLAIALGIQPRLAQKMTYCLRAMGIITLERKIGRTFQYRRLI
jgi:hypothetical protein